mmetsp:Transcript_37030/g.110901  ORF Transcript_37030/g.110901 Transcript_37030/m.110901 type:complete len:142 (+) Transcript_37030:837-1262(+)
MGTITALSVCPNDPSSSVRQPSLLFEVRVVPVVTGISVDEDRGLFVEAITEVSVAAAVVVALIVLEFDVDDAALVVGAEVEGVVVEVFVVSCVVFEVVVVVGLVVAGVFVVVIGVLVVIVASVVVVVGSVAVVVVVGVVGV